MEIYRTMFAPDDGGSFKIYCFMVYNSDYFIAKQRECFKTETSDCIVICCRIEIQDWHIYVKSLNL